eukprot:scaffold16062_cov278-Ochromonas_danica.AAC.4
MQSTLEKQDNTAEEEKRKREEVIKIEVLHGLLEDTPYKVEAAARVDLERKLEEPQTVNEKLMFELEESIKAREMEAAARVEAKIAVLLQDCSTNWLQMIESEDVTVLKTLETFNAIDRIPVSVINGRFSMTVDGEEIKAAVALHMPAVKGNAEMARLLLLHPAIDVNAVDNEVRMQTCMTFDSVIVHCAVMKAATVGNGHVEVVLVLLRDERVDVNKADKNGWTPLHTACGRGHVEVVLVLLGDERVDLNKDGWTPLHTACGSGHVEVVKLFLLEENVNANKTTNRGWTPLHCACSYGHVEVVLVLLSVEQVDVNKTDTDGRTPLYCACQYGNVEVALVLLGDERVDLNKATNRGKTALDAADEEDIKALLRAKGAI